MHGRNSTSYYAEVNGMKSQRDRVIHPVSLSELTRLRSKSPLASLTASGVGVGVGGGRGDIHSQQYLAKFFQHCFLLPWIYFKTYLLCMARYIDFPLYKSEITFPLKIYLSLKVSWLKYVNTIVHKFKKFTNVNVSN